MARIFHLLSAGLLTIALGGCETVAGSVAVVDDAGTTVTISEPGDVKYYPSDEPLRLGEEYFNRGIYGTAEKYFQSAVEKAPKDVSAWIGLAASYDRLGVSIWRTTRMAKPSSWVEKPRKFSITLVTPTCCAEN